MHATLDRSRRHTRSALGFTAMAIEPLESRCLLTVDLLAAFIAANPHTLAPSEDFTAAMVVNNEGSDSSPGFFVQMRLSTDTIVGNADDVVLGLAERPQGLAGESSTSIVRTFTIPTDTLPGSYFLAFLVDPSGSVSESNDSNNAFVSSSALITVTQAIDNVDLDVFGNGEQILDGAHLPSANNGTSFGNIEFGESQDHVFTLMNDGAGTLQILNITMAGEHSPDFVVTSTTTADIAPGQSMTVTIRFAPGAEGIRVGSIQIQTNDTDDGTGNPSVFSFAVSGVGVPAVTAAPAEVEIRGNGQVIGDGDSTTSPTDHTSFGSLRLANASVTRTFTIFNTGDTALVISGIEIFGRNASQFTILDDIDSIAPGGSATFRVRFDPTSLGQKMAQVRVLSSDVDEAEYTFRVAGRGAVNGGPGDASAEIDVFGNGQSIADGDTSPSALDSTAFGRVRRDNATRIRTYTIANTGTSVLTIDSISLFGRDADNFVILDQVTTVAAGSSETFRVRFDPDGLGNRRADLRIISNDADQGEYTFRVRGNGVSNPSGGEGEITVTGLILLDDGDDSASFIKGTHFGAVNSGNSITRTFTITNTGSAALNLTGPFVRITGRNAARFTVIQMPDETLAIGEVTTFTVQFNANGTGQRRATVEILSNDSTEAVFDFEIMGRSRQT